MEIVTAWVKPPPPAQGLDHLGTQQPCIAYYTQLLPGITNVTNRARYYSLYPWLVWALGERYPKVDLATYEDLFRKADCLLTLISERHGRVLDEPADMHGATMTGRDTLVPAVAQLEGNKKFLLSRFATREKVPERYFQNRFGGLGQYYLGPLQELGLLGFRFSELVEKYLGLAKKGSLSQTKAEPGTLAVLPSIPGLRLRVVSEVADSNIALVDFSEHDRKIRFEKNRVIALSS
jgi:hypothetical protein